MQENRQAVADAAVFRAKVLENLNKYIQDLTGAEFTENQADHLMQSAPNMEDGPTEFVAKFNSMVDAAEEIIIRKSTPGTSFETPTALTTDGTTSTIGGIVADTLDSMTGEDATGDGMSALSPEEQVLAAVGLGPPPARAGGLISSAGAADPTPGQADTPPADRTDDRLRSRRGNQGPAAIAEEVCRAGNARADRRPHFSRIEGL